MEDLKRLREGEDIPSLIPQETVTAKELQSKSEEHSKNFFSIPLILALLCLPVIACVIFLSINNKTTDITKKESSKPKTMATNTNFGDKTEQSEQTIEEESKGVEEKVEETTESVDNAKVFNKLDAKQEKLEKAETIPDDIPKEKEKPQINHFDILLNSIATDIISAKFADAVNQCDTALKDITFESKKEELNEILNQTKTLKNAKQIIKKLLLAKIGKKVGMLIPKYKDYTIEKVNKKTINIVKNLTKVKIRKKVLISAITSKGKAYCIGKENENAANIYRGICALRKKDYTNAKKYFKNVKVLANALLQHIPQNEFNAEKEISALPPGNHHVNDLNFDKEKLLLQKSVKEGKCKIPEDAQYFKGHAYKFYTISKNWKDANAFCEQQGGHLVTIADEEENVFARSITGGYNRQIRIGLQRTGYNVGDFIWCTGERLGYTNWLNSQPNNNKGHDNTVVYDIGKKWNDWHTGAIPFICEWEAPKEDRYKLTITTKTSNLKHAETDSSVYILINGNESIKYMLDDYDKNDRERGETDVYELPIEYPISKIKSIKVLFEGKDGWACDSISFQFLQGKKISKVYKFKGLHYFSSEAADKGIKEKTFKLSAVKLF